MLHELGPGLWEHRGWTRVVGVPLPRRMVVARLEPGGGRAPGLWVWSPNRLDPALRAAVDALGPVAEVVAPSRFHHAHLEAWREAYPAARVWAAPGLPEKRPDLRFDGVLGAEAPEGWGEALALAPLEGAPSSSEVEVLHRPSGTLIVTDLVFHVGAEAPWLTRLATRANGAYGRVTPTRVFRGFVEDRRAVRRTVDRLLGWSWDRLVMAHGEVVETGGRAALERAFAGW